MTKGERVIRPDFAKDNSVKEVKQLFTILYDKIDNLYHEAHGSGPHTSEVFEKLRCYQESLRNLETSAMYAVKGLTV